MLKRVLLFPPSNFCLRLSPLSFRRSSLLLVHNGLSRQPVTDPTEAVIDTFPFPTFSFPLVFSAPFSYHQPPPLLLQHSLRLDDLLDSSWRVVVAFLSFLNKPSTSRDVFLIRQQHPTHTPFLCPTFTRQAGTFPQYL